ncbi:phosphate signaling complex protein PhoU [Hippea jasoniae]|uniref:phosphate signaling complex protein PhoU n=1 Tax=Hippea jasoniae TaxID=944479 RepID=UPI000554F6B7|nr:phosphate signaling complex protein PhoU [Hippea jasoniae]
MVAFIDEDLRQLKVKISKMTHIALDMVELASDGLFNRNNEKLLKAIELDNEVDRIDNEIDEMVIKICAIRQPEATDLRVILSSLKINVSIERIADNAVSIARWGLKINKYSQLKPYVDLPKMKDIAVLMVKEAMDAFFAKDIEKSLKIIEEDKIVDQYEMKILEELFGFIAKDASNSKTAMRLMFVARAFERIADQATNIAEQALFVATGKIYKHKREPQ